MLITTKLGIIVVSLSVICQVKATASLQSETARKTSNPTRSDGYLLSMFEVVLTTMETKLRRVENLDRAVQQLMLKLDAMEKRSIVQSDSIESKVDAMSKSLDTFRTNICPLPDNREVKEDLVAEPSERQPRFWTQNFSAGNSSYNRRRRLIRKSNQAGSSEVTTASTYPTTTTTMPPITTIDKMDDMKEVVNGMDRRLGLHINIVAENLGKVAQMMEEVHNAIIDNEDDPDTKSRSKTNTTSTGHKRTKIDQLLTNMTPLIGVKEKMDEVKNMLDGTKSSVDNLVPRSEELLNNTQRQEKAISDIHSDLNEKTNAIMKELTEVESKLSKAKDSLVSFETITGMRKSDTGLENFEQNLDPDFSVSDFEDDLEDGLRASASSTSTTLISQQALTAPNPKMSVTPKARPSADLTTIATRQPNNNGSVFDFEYGNLTNVVSPVSCADLKRRDPDLESGVFYLQVEGNRYRFLKAYCDMETSGGGWTVIQRRDDFGDDRENFSRTWDDYKHGFGNPEKEFWFGNENIYLLTKNDDFELRVELDDFDGNRRYAEYKQFRLGSEKEDYRLEIGGYLGNAGDSLNDPWYGSNQRPFSTLDRDNDRSSLNCASMLKGGWWWKSCGRGLNGVYLTNPNDLAARQGIVWFRWRGWDYSLKRSRLMIRPKSFADEEPE